MIYMDENKTRRGQDSRVKAAIGNSRLRNLIMVLAVVVGLAPGKAADWYVDAEVSSNGDGRSWATAWKDFGNIGWVSVSAGDTIWLSGGKYYDTLSPTTSGSEGNPIRIKKAQSPPHDGIATLYGRYSSGQNWITLDGALDDDYAVAKVRFTYEVYNVTNNIGIRIYSGVTMTNHAVNVSGSWRNGLGLRWAEISPCINRDAGNSAVHGVRINAGNVENTVIEYCWIHHTAGDGINNAQNNDPGLNGMIFRYNLIEYIGDDGIQASGGATVHHNIIGPALPKPGSQPPSPISGHPDALQITPGHNAHVYNNVMFNWNSYITAITLRSTDYLGGHSNVLIYGNVMYHTADAPWKMEAGASMGVDGQFPWRSGTEGDYTYITNATYIDVVIANNTVVANPEHNGGMDNPFNMYNRYSPFYQPGQPGLTVSLTNWVVVNNIFYNGQDFAANFKGWPGSGWAYDESDYVVQNNIMWGPTANGKRIAYLRGTANTADYYADAEAFNAATANSRNSSAQPAFVSYGNRDFRLLSTDTAARGRGLNLSHLGLTGIEYDVWGNYRGGGAWDIGAMAFSSEARTEKPSPPTGLKILSPGDSTGTLGGPLLHLNFEDDFVLNGFAADSSGNNAHMLRYGWAANPATNFPTIGAGKVGSRSASFLPYYDSHPYTNPEFNDGQYGAITNVGRLTSLTQATFAAWVKFTPISVSNPDDRTKNHNATILNAGYDPQGAWHWGRYYSSTHGEPQFNIQTNTGGGGGSTARIKWPQEPPRFWYTNHTWKHLAVTVDCSTPTNLLVKLYTDGVNVVSQTLSLQPANAVPALRINDAPGSGWGDWIAVGCWTHNGNPELGVNTVPNNGWLNGGLDDVRIYNRVLSDAEISAIYSAP